MRLYYINMYNIALEIGVLQRFGADFGDFLFSMRKMACGKKLLPCLDVLALRVLKEGRRSRSCFPGWAGSDSVFPCPFPRSGGVQVQAPVAFQLP